jgi:uncharacterized protein YbjT (DUF2867 family)
LNKKTALIVGSSGLVGSELLQILLKGNEYHKVYALVRRPLDLKHPKLKEVICDFDRLEDMQDYFAVDDLYCGLGTTIKKAQTQEAMYKVDVEYPITIARLAKEKGANHFLVISSMNANPNSFLSYPKMKGELEERLKRISFESLSILRPSLLLGDRKEFRLGENLAIKVVQGLSRLLGRPLNSRMAIEARIVAFAMYQIAQSNKKGITIYSAKQIEAMSK